MISGDARMMFRWRYETSPYRYLLMRRLEGAREQIAWKGSLVEMALAAGFADQAHFSRMFKSACGLTPMRYRVLRATGVRDSLSVS
jgi:AraC-like DNA-binding protein